MTKHFRSSHATVFSINIQRLWALVLLKHSTDRLSATANARRWLFRLLALPLLVIGLPVQAANYTFQGSDLPAGCSGDRGNFICGALTLGAGDTISISSPTTITVNGELKTGALSKINSDDTTPNLNIVINGKITIGARTIMKSNIRSTGTVGVIDIGEGTIFVGNITAEDAAITIGEKSEITGSITTTATGATDGAVTIMKNAKIFGNILTNSGAVVTLSNVTVTGNISTRVGAITIGPYNTVGGNINNFDTSTAGAIIVEGHTIVTGSLIAGAGAVTLLDSTQTGGIVTTNGAITVGTLSRVTGSVCVNNAGEITIETKARVSGNVISKKAGAITIATEAVVAGTATILGAGDLSIVGTGKVGATASTAQCADEVVAVPPSTPRGPPTIKSREWRQLFMR